MSKPYVLIIEDDPKLVDIYQMMFEQTGFDTLIDTNGNRYQRMLLATPATLIILDLHMPFASGVDILHQIRKDARLRGVPVIVTTADVILAKSVQAEADMVLTKPVSVGRLREIALQLYPIHQQKD